MDLAYELHDLVRTLDRHAEQLLRPEGLSYNRYVALVILSEHPGMTGRELSRAIGISEPSTSGIVRRLIEDGLASDIARPGAGNLRRLEVTRAGAAKAAECSHLLGNALDRDASKLDIDPQQLAATIRNLHDQVRTESAKTSGAIK